MLLCKPITFSRLIFVWVLGMFVWWPTAMKAPQHAAALKDVIVLAFDKCEGEWSQEQFQQCYQGQTGRVTGHMCRNEITAVLLAFLQERGQAVSHSAGESPEHLLDCHLIIDKDKWHNLIFPYHPLNLMAVYAILYTSSWLRWTHTRCVFTFHRNFL